MVARVITAFICPIDQCVERLNVPLDFRRAISFRFESTLDGGDHIGEELGRKVLYIQKKGEVGNVNGVIILIEAYHALYAALHCVLLTLSDGSPLDLLFTFAIYKLLSVF